MREIEVKYQQIEEAPHKGKRKGKTTISSVSISDEFKKIIEEYNLSPTEIFRRGLAVTLAELGVEPYNNSLNRARLQEIESFFELQKYKELADELISSGEQILNKLEE